MGFNKRYINEKIIRTVLREDGIQSLIDFIKKPDSLIIEDEFSEKVCNAIRESEDKFVVMKLLETDLFNG